MTDASGAAQEPDFTVFRTDRRGIRKVLGDLEAEIMELMWSGPPEQGITVREIFEALRARRPLAYTTVMTTMARLGRKHLLRVERHDQAYLYYPNLSEERFVSRFVTRVLEDLLVGFAGSEAGPPGGPIDPATAERMRQILDEIARRRAAQEPD